MPLHELSDRWSEIDELLDEALALPATARHAWLQGLTGPGAGLRDTLARLLASHARAETDDFLNDLPVLACEPVQAVGEEPAAGDRVGPWRLLAPLGAGGMGVVWRAERADGRFKRTVALKLPRLGWHADTARRMARERDILATLEHPLIARMYEASVDEHGRPYLALELVQGEPIDAWCTRQRSSVHERLNLLLQVAQAVAHAHARLVVHRDLKPGNILVTDEGQVRLLDFGVAKLMEGSGTQDSELTRQAGSAYTPQYASPEQVRGEPLGLASDVYSLGVVAYELLAGARPYRLKRGSPAEIEEAIASAEPPLASTQAGDKRARRALQGDLDAILNRALKKDLAERYDSVRTFAQDIERHLRAEPVLARPDSRMYQLRSFLRRHRTGVAVSAALASVVVGGSGVSIWQALEARRQTGLAAEQSRRQEAVSDLYIEAMTRISTLAASRPATVAERHAVTRELQRALREAQARYATRPAEWQSMLKTVALQLNYSSDFEGSLLLMREYLQHLKAHGGTPKEVIVAYMGLGRTLIQLERLDDAEAVRREGLAWAPHDRSRDTELARLMMAADLGNVLVRRGEKRAEAQAVLMQAEASAERLFPQHLIRHEIWRALSWLHEIFDDRLSLHYARLADEGQRSNGTAALEVRAGVQGQLTDALLANGHVIEAEAVMREVHPRLVSFYGRTNRLALRALAQLSASVARQGDPARAAVLLDAEAEALQSMPGATAQEALAGVQALRLESALVHGDIAAATALVQPAPADWKRTMTRRMAGTFLAYETRALAWAGRGGEALQRIALVDLPEARPGQTTTAWLRFGPALAEAQLAAGDTAAARATADDLRTLLQAQQATGSWTYRVVVELAALAASRGGDPAGGLRTLTELDVGSPIASSSASASASTRVAAPPPPPLAPSRVDRAESALRRAQVLAAAGRGSDAVLAAQAALEDLQAQHPSSPRLALARRLAAGAR